MEDSQVKQPITSGSLMIGNLVDILNESGYISPDTGYNYRVVQLHVHAAIVKRDCDDFALHVRYDRLSPITLTEDWLVKGCGYEIAQEQEFTGSKLFTQPRNSFLTGKIQELQKVYNFVYARGIFKKVEFLHQLQNTYFNYYSQELTIKEVI